MTNVITPLMQREIVELAKQQKSAAEIGRIVGCSGRTVHRVAKRHGIEVVTRHRLFTESEDNTLIAYARAGATILMIAKALGRNTSAVVFAAKRLGVQFHRREKSISAEFGEKGVRSPGAARMAAFIEAGKQERARARA